MKIKIIEGMNPVTVSIPHGWLGNKNANILVDDRMRDAVSGTPVYKAIPCMIHSANLSAGAG